MKRPVITDEMMDKSKAIELLGNIHPKNIKTSTLTYFFDCANQEFVFVDSLEDDDYIIWGITVYDAFIVVDCLKK